ncbi:YicC/YloC family endoribonuclease [Tuberibacillus sp. Marseille-P3662]|uniref:YicC/YloC family endoribonuclease n=1 Tax=Tuberibacillus sp. Marseille-P3662 TaxID=1965358 RepID=UPI000A1C980B|nr:YicC/YloC family endoribonuclease [Tuberibacillus sp. Marseille-P3662]
MMYSMTGYGRSIATIDERELTVEMKSVNHRYLDMTVHLPKSLMYLEEPVKQIIKSYVSRGKIYLMTDEDSTSLSAQSLKTNWALLKQYIDQLEQMSDRYGIDKQLTYQDLLQLDDLFYVSDEPVDRELINDHIFQAVHEACEQLVNMRQSEGMNLADDLAMRVKQLNTTIQRLEEHAPMVAEVYQEKLDKRIREYLEDVDVDEGRLLNEVAFFSDKSNIDEEITRLKSHIKQFFDIMKEHGPKGRKLDFLIQEMNREINTIGSKAGDVTISQYVVDIKSDIEKLREQVQNVE